MMMIKAMGYWCWLWASHLLISVQLTLWGRCCCLPGFTGEESQSGSPGTGSGLRLHHLTPIQQPHFISRLRQGGRTWGSQTEGEVFPFKPPRQLLETTTHRRCPQRPSTFLMLRPFDIVPHVVTRPQPLIAAQEMLAQCRPITSSPPLNWYALQATVLSAIYSLKS